MNFKYMEVFDQLAQYVCNRYPFNSMEQKNGPTNQLSNTPVPVSPGAKDTILTVKEPGFGLNPFAGFEVTTIGRFGSPLRTSMASEKATSPREKLKSKYFGPYVWASEIQLGINWGENRCACARISLMKVK